MEISEDISLGTKSPEKTLDHELAERCFKISLKLHSDFDKKYWKDEKGEPKESFHNKFHIEAVWEAADGLIEAADSKDDPLDLAGDLEKWNSVHPMAQITSLSEFAQVVKFAVSGHDWGNIMEDLSFKDGEVSAEYLLGYKAAGAEDRSKVLITKFLEKEKGLTEGQKERYIPLISHLVEQTKFVVKEEELAAKDNIPFAKFMMVVDQIGNDFFSKNAQRVDGLTEEIAFESPDRQIKLRSHYDFIEWRFPQLVSDQTKRERVRKIWGKSWPKTHENIANRTIKAVDLAKAVRIIKKGHLNITSAEEEFLDKTLPMRDYEEIAKQEGIAVTRREEADLKS